LFQGHFLRHHAYVMSLGKIKTNLDHTPEQYQYPHLTGVNDMPR
jgi:hypothetical protein